MKVEHTLPADIERTSMAIITEELKERGISLPSDQAPVVKRVIHTTADFDYAENLFFTPDAIEKGTTALLHGTHIITDTNMAKAGISAAALKRLDGEAHCFIACDEVVRMAREEGTTRAVAAVKMAAQTFPQGIWAIGNAPTALLEIANQIEQGLRPALVIGVPVGFVNVEESKKHLRQICKTYGVPAIIAMGRKGGSNVAAAICNALLYIGAQMLDPADRGWQG